MSNDVALFNGKLPGYLKNAELDATTKALAGGGGGKRISIKGSVFRLIVDGQEVAQKDERAMNAVIVAAAPAVGRTYYEGEYKEGQVTAPDCWSNDGIAPDASIQDPQSSKCATCRQNVAGSGQGESRACRYSQRVAVVLDTDMEGDVYQVTLPAQSIFGKPEGGKMPLQAYAKHLAAHGVPVTAVVTELRFDTNSATPKLTFKPVRPLTEEEYEICKRQGQTPDAQTAITMTAAQMDGAKPKAERAGSKSQEKRLAVQREAAQEEDKPTAEDEPVVRQTAKARTQEVSNKMDISATLAKWDDED